MALMTNIYIHSQPEEKQTTEGQPKDIISGIYS